MATVAPEKQIHPLPAIAFNGVVKGDDVNARIGAIETEYAGYKFRSRLEARWAVFFDSLGVEWRYEPEGFEAGRTRYLPDFYLPELKVWCEVKAGDCIPECDATRMSDVLMSGAIEDVFKSYDDREPERTNRGLVLLGDVPESQGVVLHRIIQHSDKDGLVSLWCSFMKFDGAEVCFHVESCDGLLHIVRRMFVKKNIQTNPGAADGWSLDVRQIKEIDAAGSVAAYAAARRARFEHGRRGAV